MADELKPPVAIRITRPYATEAEFLEREFDTLTHTSVVLLGAQSRPQGVVLRFEIVLKNGDSMLRGEGRVVGYKDKAYQGEPGLTLRFTRLDSRSKSLVDRASALRDARVRASTSLMSMPAVVVPRPAAEAPPPHAPAPPRSSAPPPPPARPSAPPPASRRAPPPLPAWANLGPPPPPAISADIESTQVDAHFNRAPPAATASPAEAPPAPKQGIRPTPARPPPLPRSIPSSPPPPPVAPPAAARPVAAREPVVARERARAAIDRPAEREALLFRLRARGQSLPAARVREILAKTR